MRLYVADASVHLCVPQRTAARKNYSYCIKALNLHFFQSYPTNLIIVSKHLLMNKL